MNIEAPNLSDGLGSIDKLLQALPKEGGLSAVTSGMSGEGIVASIFFGILGMIYFRHGKKHGPMSTALYGLVLMIYPYFVYDLFYVVAIGLLFTVLPFVLKFG